MPLDSEYRPYRMGMLEDALLLRGHRITRWCSDLNHLSGDYRYGFDKTVHYNESQTFEVLNSGFRYLKSTSALRVLDNFILANKIKKKALRAEKPDLIVCSMPSPAVARTAAEIARHFGVPLILDARDYWPDIFNTELSWFKKILAQPVIYFMRRDLKMAASVATSLVGITPFFRYYLLRYSGRALSELDNVCWKR